MKNLNFILHSYNSNCLAAVVHTYNARTHTNTQPHRSIVNVYLRDIVLLVQSSVYFFISQHFKVLVRWLVGWLVSFSLWTRKTLCRHLNAIILTCSNLVLENTLMIRLDVVNNSQLIIIRESTERR